MRPSSAALALFVTAWCLTFCADAEAGGTPSMPSVDDILNKAINALVGTYEVKPGCSAKIQKSNDCKITFASNPTGCVTPKDLAEKLLGEGSDVASKIPSSVSLESAEVDKCSKTFDMTITTTGDYEIVPGIITLKNARIWMKYYIQTKTLHFNVTGTWLIGNIRFSVSVFKVDNEIEFSGSLIPASGNLNMQKIMNAIGDNLIPGNKVRDAVSKIGFNNLAVGQVAVQSKFEDRGFAVRLSFTGKDAPLGNPTIFLTLIKLTNGTTGVTIAGSFTNLGLSQLLNKVAQLARLDVSRIPVIGTTTFGRLGMLLSTLNLDPPIIPYDNAYINELMPIRQGLQLLTDIKFTVNSPSVKVRISITTTLVEFKFVGDSGISVKEFIELIISLSNINLPPKFNLATFFNLRLTSFTYDTATKTFTLPVVLSDPIIFVPNSIELENATIIFTVRTSPRQFGLETHSTWQLGSLFIPLSISKPLGLPVFLGESRPPVEIPFGTMIKQFLVALLPSGALENAVKKAGFDGFYIKQPYIKIYFASDVVVRVAGTAVIGAWDKCQVEIMLGQVRGAFVMATGIVLENVPLTTLIYKITDKRIDIRNIPGASLLDNTDVAISMSSQNIPRVQEYMQFSIPALSDVEILDGVIVLTSFKFPTDCKTDVGCKVFKRLLGANAQLVLKGRLAIASVYLYVTIPTEIELFKGVNISDVGLEIEAGPTSNSFGIKGTLKLEKPPITFTGSFGISTGGVFLQMSMAGLWKKPFGVPFLAVGDLHLRVAVSPLPGFITVLEFGGRGMIGLIDNPRAKPINASMYFGIDRVSPLENFFYGSSSALTLRSIAEAFGRSVSLPRALAESGFPKGINVSFALKTKVLPNGVTIVRGFFIQGMIKILAFEAFADMKINLNGFWINMTVRSFNIGNGLIAISGRPGAIGPRIMVDIGWNPPRAYINIEGTIQVLRIRATTNVTISSKGVSFEVSGSFLGLFDAGLKLTAAYSNLKTADFQVSGYFRQKLIQRLATGAKNALNRYKQNADRAINSAKARISRGKKAFDDAANKIAGLRNKVNSQKAKFDRAIRTLESRKKYFEDKKKIFDNASRKLRDARNYLSRKQREYNNAVKRRADKLRAGCPSNCRKKKKVPTATLR